MDFYTGRKMVFAEVIDCDDSRCQISQTLLTLFIVWQISTGTSFLVALSYLLDAKVFRKDGHNRAKFSWYEQLGSFGLFRDTLFSFRRHGVPFELKQAITKAHGRKCKIENKAKATALGSGIGMTEITASYTRYFFSVGLSLLFMVGVQFANYFAIESIKTVVVKEPCLDCGGTFPAFRETVSPQDFENLRGDLVVAADIAGWAGFNEYFAGRICTDKLGGADYDARKVTIDYDVCLSYQMIRSGGTPTENFQLVARNTNLSRVFGDWTIHAEYKRRSGNREALSHTIPENILTFLKSSTASNSTVPTVVGAQMVLIMGNSTIESIIDDIPAGSIFALKTKFNMSRTNVIWISSLQLALTVGCWLLYKCSSIEDTPSAMTRLLLENEGTFAACCVNYVHGVQHTKGTKATHSGKLYHWGIKDISHLDSWSSEDNGADNESKIAYYA